MQEAVDRLLRILLVVPMMPDGPRLIHPTVCRISPSTPSSTRPEAFGMTARRSSKGRPGIGTPRYPTDRNTRPTGIVSISSVARARIAPPASATSSLRRTVIDSTLPAPSIATGEVRKRRLIRRGLPAGAPRRRNRPRRRCPRARRTRAPRIAEGGLGRAAATEHDDLAHCTCAERFEGMVGHVGAGQLVHGQGEHARHQRRRCRCR
jgi:hypothetical protein